MRHFQRIEQIDDVYVDGLLVHADRLAFVSFFGTDTRCQEILAKMSLKPTENGFLGSTLTFLGDGGVATPAFVSHARQLEARKGHMPADGLFSDRLCHVMIYDPVLTCPDRSSRCGALIKRGDERTFEVDQLWTLVTETVPLPLLDEWREPLLDAFFAEGWFTEIEGFGLSAVWLDLAHVALDDWMSAWLRAGATTERLAA